jgi:hypothetical protein
MNTEKIFESMGVSETKMMTTLLWKLKKLKIEEDKEYKRMKKSHKFIKNGIQFKNKKDYQKYYKWTKEYGKEKKRIKKKMEIVFINYKMRKLNLKDEKSENPVYI